jgi:hypothetical protein
MNGGKRIGGNIGRASTVVHPIRFLSLRAWVGRKAKAAGDSGTQRHEGLAPLGRQRRPHPRSRKREPFFLMRVKEAR